MLPSAEQFGTVGLCFSSATRRTTAVAKPSIGDVLHGSHVVALWRYLCTKTDDATNPGRVVALLTLECRGDLVLALTFWPNSIGLCGNHHCRSFHLCEPSRLGQGLGP
jgi:hypothetical protein